MKKRYEKGTITTMSKYNYEHIAKKLIEQHAWVRVPYYIPLTDKEKETVSEKRKTVQYRDEL